MNITKCRCKHQDKEDATITVKIKNRIKNFKKNLFNSASYYCNSCDDCMFVTSYHCPDSVCSSASCVCPNSGDCEFDGFPTMPCG